jgi:hypothetical protein
VTRTSLFVRLAVVANAIMLVGGCVAYHSGAFDWFTGGSASRAEPTAQQPSGDASQSAPALLPGSKVGIQFREVKLPDGRVVEEVEPIPGNVSSDSQTPAAPQQPGPGFNTNIKLILPGSKSNPVFIPEDVKKPTRPMPPADSETASPPK